MGVKGLMKMIQYYAPNSIEMNDYKEYSGNKIAIDIALTIYKFVLAIRKSGQDLTRKDGKITSHIYGILSKIENMLKYGIIGIPVFDGKSPDIKKDVVEKRKDEKIEAKRKLEELKSKQDTTTEDNESNEKEKKMLERKSYYITGQQIKDIKKLVELLGFPIIQSPGEADSQCAILNATGYVDSVATEDMDLLAFGARRILRNFSNKKKVTKITLFKILEEMKITREQFVELCIILGSDYSNSIKGIGIKGIYNIYKKYGNMKDFIKHLDDENNKYEQEGKKKKYIIPQDFKDKWEEIKNYYLNATVIDPLNINFIWKKPDKEKLIEFLCEENEFNKIEIEKKIDYIMERYNSFNKYNKLEFDSNKLNKNYVSEIKKSYNEPKNKNYIKNIKENVKKKNSKIEKDTFKEYLHSQAHTSKPKKYLYSQKYTNKQNNVYNNITNNDISHNDNKYYTNNKWNILKNEYTENIKNNFNRCKKYIKYIKYNTENLTTSRYYTEAKRWKNFINNYESEIPNRWKRLRTHAFSNTKEQAKIYC